MKKRSILAALALGVTVLLSACGQTSSKQGTSDHNGKVTITFWHRMTGSYNAALLSYIKEFNKSQNKYKVVATSQGSFDNLQQKYLAAAKANTLPTVGQVTDIIIPEYAHDGMLANINSLVKANFSKAELDDIYPGIAQNLKYKGDYYTLPFNTGTRIMFYNKDILDKYHLQVPKTWDELTKDSQLLKKEGITGVAFNQSYDFEYETLAHDLGNPLITKNFKAQLDTKKSIKAMTAITSMLKAKTAVTAGSDVYFNVPFVNGKIFAGFGSSATIAQIEKTAPKTMHWGTAVMPSFEGKSGSVLGNNGLAVFKNASKAQKQGAIKFMKFLMGKNIQARFAMATGYVPVVKSAVKTPKYQAYLKSHPTYQAAIDAYQDAFSSTPFIGYNAYRTALVNAVSETVSRGAAPKTVLKNLQTKTESILTPNK